MLCGILSLQNLMTLELSNAARRKSEDGYEYMSRLQLENI